MSGLIRRILIIANIVLAVALALSYLAPYVSPQTFWPLAFLGLIFPFLVVVNLAFLVFWVSRKRWYFLISLVVLLIGIHPISRTYQLSGMDGEQADAGGQSLKVLSYNVRVFGLVGHASYGEPQEKIFRLIRQEDPDVVCFQEFYVNPSKGLSLEKVARELPGMPYHHVVWLSKGNESKYGIATFSKYPLVRKGRVVFERTYNASIYSDILIDKKRMRIFNNHLQSIRFKRSDYQFISNQNQYNDSEKLKALQKISFRLRDAFIKRSGQAEEISRHIRRSSYPVLVCGDFNDTPVSYTYHTIRHRLKDAFVEAGSGMGTTYKGQFPSFRIDYIFYDPAFGIRSYEKCGERLSDHYPIVATFDIP